MNQNSNIERNRRSPEQKRRGASLGVKIATVALSLVMSVGTFAACKEIGKNNSESGKESFYPNGGLPFAKLVDFDEFRKSDDTVNGGNKYEYIGDTKNISLSFKTLDGDEVFVLGERGSVRTTDVSSNPEQPSSILLSGQDIVFGKVDKIGYYSVPNSDNYYMIELDETPQSVQDFVKENEIELSTLEGEDYVFINQIDANIVSAKSVAVTPIGDVSLAA